MKKLVFIQVIFLLVFMVNSAIGQVCHGDFRMNNSSFNRQEDGQSNSQKSIIGWIGLTLTNSDAGNSLESYVIINPDATTGFDMLYDLEYQPGKGLQFYSLAGQEKLSTNSLPSVSAESEINFVFLPEQGTNYSIEASGLELIEEPVFLYDRKSRSDQNLSMDPVYNFTAMPGDDSTRFVLRFGPTGIENAISGQEKFTAWYQDQMLCFNTVGKNDILMLSNVQGRKLLQLRPGESNRLSFPVNLAPGIYVVRLISGTQSFTRKILVG
jgi:hypothetical protein